MKSYRDIPDSDGLCSYVVRLVGGCYWTGNRNAPTTLSADTAQVYLWPHSDPHGKLAELTKREPILGALALPERVR